MEMMKMMLRNTNSELIVHDDNLITLRTMRGVIVSQNPEEDSNPREGKFYRLLKQLYLSEFYKNPWDNMIWSAHYNADDAIKDTYLSILNEYSKKFYGTDLAKWAIQNEFAYTKKVKVEVLGIKRDLRLKYTFNTHGETMNILLEGYIAHSTEKDEQAVWPTDEVGASFIQSVFDDNNIELTMKIKPKSIGRGEVEIPTFIPTSDDIIAANMKKLEAFYHTTEFKF